MLKHVAAAGLAGALSALLASPAVLACDGEDHDLTTAQAPAAEPKALEVDQLATLMEQAAKNKTPLFIYDANTDPIRRDKGMIPTAIKLSSSSRYELSLLPKNKGDAAVFYCSSERCGASKSAAKRAIQAGYTNVHVLPAGILGWVKAGKPVEKPQV